MTLSKGGNPDVYVLDLGTRQLTQLTDHYAIDTEPPSRRTAAIWCSRPTAAASRRSIASPPPADRPQRVTFEGDYNAAASYAPDGRSLVMVTREGGVSASC
jgi:TolB protein